MARVLEKLAGTSRKVSASCGEGELAWNHGIAQVHIVESRAALAKQDARFSTQASHAHHAERNAFPCVLEKFEETSQVSVAVRAGHDLNQIRRQFFGPACDCLQGRNSRRACEIMERDDAFHFLLLGRGENGAEGRDGTQLKVDEGGQRQVAEQELPTLFGGQGVLAPFRRVPCGQDERLLQTRHLLFHRDGERRQCIETQLKKLRRPSQTQGAPEIGR